MTDTKNEIKNKRAPLAYVFVSAALIFSVGLGLFAWIRSHGEDRATPVKRALSARKFDEARQLIDNWEASNPRDGDPYYYRARLETTLDHPVEALQALQKATDRGYDEKSATILRAVMFARAGMFDKAEPILAAASREGAEPNAEIAEGLARIYLATFRLPEASAAIDNWIAAAPDDPHPYISRSDIDERMGIDAPVLIRNYRTALEKDPTFDVARLKLAKLLLGTNQLNDAEAEFATFLKAHPESLDGQLGSGQVALLKGDLIGAENFFMTALGIDPNDAVALSELASLDLRNSRFKLATERLKRAVDAYPFDPEIRYKYSRALKVAGEEALAAQETVNADRLRTENQRITQIREELVNHPDDAEKRYEAAKWLIEHGQEKEGIKWTELILKQKPGHAATCRLLADHYTKQGNAGLANYYKLLADAGR